jgi:hypothetical protein
LVDSLRKETVRQASESGKAIGEILRKIARPFQFWSKRRLHAPFPLPKVQVNTCWTFKTGAGRPTLPVLAFQIYAFDVYEDLVDLLPESIPHFR